MSEVRRKQLGGGLGEDMNKGYIRKEECLIEIRHSVGGKHLVSTEQRRQNSIECRLCGKSGCVSECYS